MRPFHDTTPLALYESVQLALRFSILVLGNKLETVERMLNGSPRVAPYWLLPPGTPTAARIWLSPKRRVQ